MNYGGACDIRTMFGYGGESRGRYIRTSRTCPESGPYHVLSVRLQFCRRKPISLTGGLTGEVRDVWSSTKQDVLVLKSRGVDSPRRKWI